MKKGLLVLCAMLLLAAAVLPGCTQQSTEATQTEQDQVLITAEEAPTKLKNVFENNLFHDVTAYKDRILKTVTIATDKESREATYKVQMLDLLGKELAAYTVTTNEAYYPRTLTATSDGGFLFVLGFSDRSYGVDVWASDNGFASRVIKCDKHGNVQFDTPMENIIGSGLSECFEKDGKFYFFGTIETPDTKTRGVWSPSDVHMVIMNAAGAVEKTKCLVGSRYDSVIAAEYTDRGFVLSIFSNSSNGDFLGSGARGYHVDWVITVDDTLTTISEKLEKGRDILDDRIGEMDGKTLYQSDEMLKDFDAGEPQVILDYGSFYMIVSENITGEIDTRPLAISSKWYYTETVYSGYDYEGNLLFRESIDSTPAHYIETVEEARAQSRS